MGEQPLSKRKDKSRNTKKIVLPIAIILFGALASLGAYYFTSYKNDSGYINQILNEKAKIDKANSTSGEVLNNFENIDLKNTEELSKITKALSSSEGLLQDSLKDVKSITPNNKFKNQNDNLILAMEANKKIYTQTLLILQNPTHKDIDNAVDALKKYIKDASNYYKASQIKKVSISLPEEILTLGDKITQFVQIEKTDYEAKSRVYEQYSKYFDEMDKIVSEFKKIKTDLQPNIDLIKSNKATIEDTYLVIERKLISLNDIKTSLDKVSVPPKTIKEHEKFSNIIKGYMDYCEEFKKNVIEFEEAGDDSNKLNGVNQLFDQLKKQYKNIDSSFNDYSNKYEQDKSTYGNVSNI